MEKYMEMTTETIIAYVKKIGIFKEDAILEAKEIGDGNLNYVFRIVDSNNNSVVVKQALPYLKIAGSGWKLTLDRNRIEADAMKLQDQVCPGFVPKVFHHSDVYALTVMEDLGEMKIMRKGLMEMQHYPNFAKQIGEFLAKNFFRTTDFALGAPKKKEYVAQFISPELCDITEKLVLTNPYYDAEDNNINPHIKEYVEKEIWNDHLLRKETAKLKTIFMTKAESLLHGDLHTGSIFINDDKIKVFDTEFAFYGPYGYDIGLLMANILLNYASWEGRPEVDKEKISEYRKYELELIKDIWNNFLKEVEVLWKTESKDVITAVEGFKEEYIDNMLNETLGFCTCEIMRRIIGMAHVPDLDTIEDLEKRAKAQILGLKIAKKMILKRNEITKIEEILDIIDKEI